MFHLKVQYIVSIPPSAGPLFLDKMALCSIIQCIDNEDWIKTISHAFGCVSIFFFTSTTFWNSFWSVLQYGMWSIKNRKPLSKMLNDDCFGYRKLTNHYNIKIICTQVIYYYIGSIYQTDLEAWKHNKGCEINFSHLYKESKSREREKIQFCFQRIACTCLTLWTHFPGHL